MPEDIVRVLRLIEYEGPRSLVEKQIMASLTNGTRVGQKGGAVRITVVTVNEFPQIIEEARAIPAPLALLELQRQCDMQTERNDILVAELRELYAIHKQGIQGPGVS